MDAWVKSPGPDRRESFDGDDPRYFWGCAQGQTRMRMLRRSVESYESDGAGRSGPEVVDMRLVSEMGCERRRWRERQHRPMGGLNGYGCERVKSAWKFRERQWSPTQHLRERGVLML